MWVMTGDKVEVRSDEEGFIGVWYAAEVVHLESPSTCVVEYEQLLTDDPPYGSPLQELVSIHNLRPCPPPLPTCCSWLQGHLVEAYDRDGWWAGVVVCAIPDLDLVLVRFRTTGEEIGFPPSHLRGLQNWDNGKWIDLTQIGQPDEYHPANAADANGSSSCPHPTEMRKRGRPRKTLNGCELPGVEESQIGQPDEYHSANAADANGSSCPPHPNEMRKRGRARMTLNGCELPGMEESEVPNTIGHILTSQELCLQQAELPKRKIRLELVAYQLLWEALRLKGPLSWEQERLLSDVRLHLDITSAEQTFVLERFIPLDDGEPVVQS